MLFLGTDVEHPRWRFLTVGAGLAVALWLLASGGFAIYVTFFGAYNKMWGSLAAVIIMLTWLWLSSLTLLFAAEVDAETERTRASRTSTESIPAERLIPPAASASPRRGHDPEVREEAIFFSTPAELRAWLEEHHATASELWVGYYKKASGRRCLTWSDVVDEALCFGWIDGKTQRIDEHRYRQRLTPRKRNSNWSAVNIAKVADLRAQGRMTPAGEAAFAARRPDRTGTYSYEQRHEAMFDAEQEAAFRADAPAWEWFAQQAPSYRTMATFWVVSAKRPETRARRLATLIECSAARRRVPPLTP